MNKNFLKPYLAGLIATSLSLGLQIACSGKMNLTEIIIVYLISFIIYSIFSWLLWIFVVRKIF